MEAMGGEAARRACALLALLAAILATGKPALATKHVVGGKKGWSTSGDLSAWASSNTFRVGDEVVFKYTAQYHDVVELPTEKRYKACDVSGLSITMSGGKNTLKLTKPGTRYFACGQPGHCKRGMKVKIKTIGKYDAAPPKHEAPASKPPAHHHEHEHTPSATAPSSHTPSSTSTTPSSKKPSAYTATSKNAHSSTTKTSSKSSSWSLMGSCPPAPLVAMAVLSSTVLGLVMF